MGVQPNNSGQAPPSAPAAPNWSLTANGNEPSPGTIDYQQALAIIDSGGKLNTNPGPNGGPSAAQQFDQQMQATGSGNQAVQDAITPIMAAIYAQSPEYKWMLTDPQLNVTYNGQTGNLIQMVVAHQLDPATMNALLQTTQWWQTNSDSIRQIQQLQAQDPAQYQQQLAQQATSITQTASTWGLNLSSAAVQQLAAQALSLNWTPAQLSEQLGQIALSTGYQGTNNSAFGGSNVSTGSALNPQGTAANVSGSAGQQGQGQIYGIMDSYLQQAKAQLINLSPTTAFQWAVNTLAGNTDSQSFANYVQQQAKALFPQFANQIDAGVTMQQIAQPYANAAGNLLGKDPQQINFYDPQFLTALTGNSSNGNQPMSLQQWNTYLMANPTFGYAQTTQAKNQAADLAATIGTAFGRTTSPASAAPEFARTA